MFKQFFHKNKKDENEITYDIGHKKINLDSFYNVMSMTYNCDLPNKTMNVINGDLGSYTTTTACVALVNLLKLSEYPVKFSFVTDNKDKSTLVRDIIVDIVENQDDEDIYVMNYHPDFIRFANFSSLIFDNLESPKDITFYYNLNGIIFNVNLNSIEDILAYDLIDIHYKTASNAENSSEAIKIIINN